MKKNIKWAVGFFTGMAILLSGCQVAGDSVTLIDTPKLADERKEDIKAVLKKLLPAGSEYEAAKNSEPKQSIFIEDMNNDSKQEGFVLYRDNKENHPVHLMVLEENNGSWEKLSDVATDYNYLDYFKLVDLDGDGTKEVVIGLGISDTESKNKLYIYEFKDNSLINRVETEYEWTQIDDYDEDNKPDLFLLNGEVNTAQSAELYHYEEGQLKLQSSLELTPDTYHENIVSGKLADGKRAVFIDSGYGAHSMLTEIVAYDKDKLIRVGDEKDGILLKEYPLYSKDINQDGIIEVGGMYIPKGYEDAAFAEIPFIYTYNDYRMDGTSSTIEQRYSDDYHHYYIKIPPEWYDKVTINKLEDGIKLIANEDQQVLFEVKWMDAGPNHGNGIKLGETKDTYFYTEIKEDTPISRDNFHLLEEDFK